LRKGFPRQTAHLEGMQLPPQEWVDAAFADEQARSDPETIRRNAAKYDNIFGPEDAPGLPVSEPEAPAATDEAALSEEAGADTEPEVAPGRQRPAQTEPDGPSPDWSRNRALMAECYALGIRGIRELRNTTPLAEVAQRNAELEALILERQTPGPD
jgi:hypothetical protein